MTVTRPLRLVLVAAAFSVASLLPGAQAPKEAPTKTTDKPAAKVTPGKYNCVFMTVKGLQTVPGFEILEGGAYRHRDGSEGAFEFRPSTRRITFRGGSLDKTGALFDGTKPKADYIRLFNQLQTQTILDCETPKH